MSAAELLRPPVHTSDGVPGRMSATRADLYSSVHKALRLFASDTLSALGRLDVGDEEELGVTLAQAESLLAMLRRHTCHETDFIHPAIEARLPGAASRVADEHVEQLHLISELETEVHGLRVAAIGQRRLLAHQLYLRFALFLADKLRHMHSEEISINAALWAHYSDSELAAMHACIVLNLSPTELCTITHWLVPAVTPAELASFLACMQDKLPAEAFTALEAHAQRRSALGTRP